MALSKYFTPEALQKNQYVARYYFTLHGNLSWSTDRVNDAVYCIEHLLNHLNELSKYVQNADKPIHAQSPLTYNNVVVMVEYLRKELEAYSSFGIREDVFGGEELYGRDAQLARLGLAPEVKIETKYFKEALELLQCFYDAKLIDFKRLQEEASHVVAPTEETPPPAPSSELPTAGAIPIIPGGGKAADEADKKKEEKEKKKEEEEKKKYPDKPLEKDSFTKLAESDRLFRREVMRIESAITHQLASIYGVPENQYQAFSEHIARYVTPIILVKLKSLNSTDLETALQNSPFARIKIYQQTLSSLQRSVVFQATLKKYLIQTVNAEGKIRTEAEIQQLSNEHSLEKVAQSIEPFYVQAANKDKSLGENPLTPAQIAIIAESHAVSADTIESSLRNLLKQTQLGTGRKITDSQIDDVFVRLQRLGLTKQYAATLSDHDLDAFFAVFRQSFGHEADGIIKALRFVTGGENDRFLARILLHYSDKISLAIFHNSAEVPSQRNLAALYTVPQNVPAPLQKEVDKSLELKIQERGYKGIGLAMFSSAASIQSRKRGTEKEKNIIEHALSFKTELQYHMEMHAQKTRVLNKKGKRILSVREKTITYLFGQIFGIETTDIQTQLHFDRFDGEADYYEIMPSFLMNLEDDELSQSFSLPFFDAKQDNKEAQKRKDEEMGLFAAKVFGFLFLGPEAFEAVEKIYQVAGVVRNIPIIGEIVDKNVFDKFRLAGKLFDLLLKGILFITALNILGPILWILGALKAWDAAVAFFQQLNLLSSLQAGLNNLTRGAGELAGTTAKNAASGAQAATRHLAGMNGAAQEGLGAPISVNAVIYGTVGIVVGTVVVQSIIMSSFLTPRQYAGGLLPYGNVINILEGFEGCWPTTGTVAGWHRYPNGSSHRVWGGGGSGPVAGFPEYGPKGTAIDIGTGATGFNDVRTPFSGNASYFPDGTGVDHQYGNHVVVTTTNYLIIFAHLLDLAGSGSNVPVQAGQLLGHVDATGNAGDTNHLHYEVIPRYGFYIDVLDLLPLPLDKKKQIASNEKLIEGIHASIDECANN